MTEKDKSSRKKWLKVALMVVVLVVASLCIWYYSIPTDSDILVLDKSVLTVISDNIPDTREDALSVAPERIINETGVPKRSFDRYFKLMDTSHAQFQWQLVYNVTGNPDLTVFFSEEDTTGRGLRHC